VELDPVFHLPTPLVFAHRGSVGEAPESTEEAFRHALVAGADVLELDVSLSKDREIVVWHGPSLDNVYAREGRLFGKKIGQLNWSDLDGNAWVVHPAQPSEVPEPVRALISLKQFVTIVRRIEHDLGLKKPVPWNIEIKQGRGWPKRFDTLLNILKDESERRRIVLAVTYGCNLARVRRKLRRRGETDRYALNVIGERQIIEILLPWLCSRGSLKGRAFQTSHRLVTPKLVDRVHARGGAVHAFLTPFPLLKGIEHLSEPDLADALEELLERGVDGIMTDYPARVIPLVRQAAARRATRAAATGIARPSPEDHGQQSQAGV